MTYQPRFYRKYTKSGLVDFTVKDRETDVLISAERDLKEEAEKLIRKYRSDISGYIEKNRDFETSLKPLPPDERAPDIVKSMIKAAATIGVGPMACVAGAISEFVGNGLLRFTKQVMLENGGDLFVKTEVMRKIGIYAGDSPLSGKIAIEIRPASTPVGVCTSSGTVGHSLSFGKADAVTILAPDTSLADACATATCNMVKTEKDIEKALEFAKSIESILGAVVIYRDKMGTIGEITISRGER